MKFLYKINSSYDGFTPGRIEQRLNDDGDLELGWNRYLDSVDTGDECWVYFVGRHSFTPGVYIKGLVREIDRDQNTVFLRLREYSLSSPLTDMVTSARIASVVGVRYRQVFLWPDEWNVSANCSLASCGDRLCENCQNWGRFPKVTLKHFNPPGGVWASAIIPAFWIVPSRCYLYREGKQPSRDALRVTHMFEEFKLGESNFGYPFALGMYNSIVKHLDIEFDAVIPIPLSPEKLAAGELHRTKLLATELGRLLGVPVRDYLSLKEPVSKRRMVLNGYTANDFYWRYYRSLNVSPSIQRLNRVLLIDDVITKGTTISCASRKMREANGQLDIVVATAGQMILKSSVLDERSFLS